jgi:hypothetical protein
MSVNSAPPISINIDSPTTNFNINTNIDIDTASTTIVGFAVPTVIDATLPATMVDITGSTISNTTSPSIVDFVSAPAIDSLAATIVDLASSSMGVAAAKTRGFDMAFGLFNFRVNDDGVAELISISDLTPPTADPSRLPAIEGNPLTTTPLTQRKNQGWKLRPHQLGQTTFKIWHLILANGFLGVFDNADK